MPLLTRRAFAASAGAFAAALASPAGGARAQPRELDLLRQGGGAGKCYNVMVL